MRLYGTNIIGAVKKNEGSSKSETYIKWSIGVVQDQKISVTRRSINTIKENAGYMWLVDKDGRTTNEEDPKCANHAMSAIRYGIVSLVNKPNFTKVSASPLAQKYYPELNI
jgi:phage terminase large subunit